MSCWSSPVEVQSPLKSNVRDVKELSGRILGERRKSPDVIFDVCFIHVTISFRDNDTETSQTLQRLLTHA